MVYRSLLSVLAALTTFTPVAVGQSKNAHAVLRLGHLGSKAVVLGCLTDAELNAKAEAGRAFGWQFKSEAFRCRSGASELPSLAATCTPKDDEPDFMDFFFASAEDCRSFETAITPACAGEPAAACLEFMETYFKPKRALASPI